MKEVSIFSDGACSGNPGPGGWGAILVYNGIEKVLSGGERETTNNRMELTGVIVALRALKEKCRVTVTSDSEYVIKGINEGWAEKWRENGWMRNKKEAAKNANLWQELLELCEKHEVTFEWVKGHAENPMNNRCDELAVEESKKFR